MVGINLLFNLMNMKKYLIYIAALSIAAVSCSSEKVLDDVKPGNTDIEIPVDDVELVPMEFSAVYATDDSADSESVKSVLGDAVGGKRSVIWQTNDEISVFDGTGNRKFVSRSTGESVSFSGEAAEASAYYALYPYQESATISGTSITASVPQYQNLVPNSFGPESALAVAAIKGDNNFSFKQATALLRITIPAGCTNISYVNIYSNNGEAICGTVKINATTGAMSLQSGFGNIQMTHWWAAEESYNVPADYYVSIVPGTLASGLSLEVHYADGDYIKRASSKSITFKAGNIYNLGELITEPFGAKEKKTAVDLGLPRGTKWSSMNLGADNAYDTGAYLQFLAPKEASVYNVYTINKVYTAVNTRNKGRVTDVESNYSRMGDFNSETDLFIKTYRSPSMKYYIGDGNDNEYIHAVAVGHENHNLDPAFTTEGVGWGSGWCSASKKDWNELVTYCRKVWVTYNGHDGWLFIGPNKNSIFIPAAGFKGGKEKYLDNESGFYWTSTVDFPASTPSTGLDYWKSVYSNLKDWSEPKYMYQSCVDFDTNVINVHVEENCKARGRGLTIRPVEYHAQD